MFNRLEKDLLLKKKICENDKMLNIIGIIFYAFGKKK